jgi:hypothetical protein
MHAVRSYQSAVPVDRNCPNVLGVPSKLGDFLARPRVPNA